MPLLRPVDRLGPSTDDLPDMQLLVVIAVRNATLSAVKMWQLCQR